MHTNQNHKTTYRIITALLLILWVAFIFSNSMDNADASTLKSGAVLACLDVFLAVKGRPLRSLSSARQPISRSLPLKVCCCFWWWRVIPRGRCGFSGGLCWPVWWQLLQMRQSSFFHRDDLLRWQMYGLILPEWWRELYWPFWCRLLSADAKNREICTAGFFCRRFYVKMSGSKSVGIRLTGRWM